MNRAAFSTFIALLGVVGCSSDGSDGAAEGGATGAAATGAGNGGSSGNPSGPECEDGPGHGTPTEPQQVDVVSAVLVDQDGEPLGGEDVQVCGLDLCTYGTSGPDGGVVIDPRDRMKKPAFKFGEGKVSARFAWLLPDRPTIDLGTVSSVRLPALGEGEPIIAGNDASSGGLTLSIAPGGAVRFDAIVFRTADERKLRALLVPEEQQPAAVDRELAFGAVYAATPVETSFCPPAKVTVPNTPGWEPGAEAELWLHGVDVTEEWAPYGGWAKVSDARVSDDGTTLSTTEPGLPELGVIAFKLK